MKKAIVYAIIFGFFAGLLTFVLRTFLNLNSILIQCLIIGLFVGLGTYLGIFKKKQ